MDLTVNARMAEYYEKFIELQEKLRKSEGERMNLEMKFNEMMQKSREEEQMYYRKLRSQYKKFLEEDRKRQERNEKIIRTLERIETRIDMLTSKTERFKSLRKQYQNYLQRVSSSQEPIPVNSSRYNLLPNEKSPNDNDKLFETNNQKLNEEKMEILDRYLESISSQRCKELIEKRKLENEQLEKLDVLKDRLNNGFDSSKAQSIAEDIMNSIYNRHYNKDQNNEEKYLSSNNERPSVKVSFENNDLVTSINVSDDDDEDYLPRLKQENANVYERNMEVTKLDKDLSNYQNGKLSKIENDTKEKEKRIFVEDSHELRFVPSDLILKSDEDDERKDEETTNNQKECEKLDTLELSYKNIKEDPSLISTDSNNPKKNQTIANETDDFVEIKNIGYSEGENFEKYDANKGIAEEQLNPDIPKERNKLEQPITVNKDQVNILENTATTENDTLVAHTIENIPENIHDNLLNEGENEKIIENISEQETINGKPEPEQNTIQHTENSQILQNAEGEPPIQYNETEYDQHEQTPQIDKCGQIIQYDENGQVIPYGDNGQSIQYDEQGQAIQYDENGQQIQYDENGQAIQYDENGQVIQYDQNGQAFQYDENGQPMYYDETGQRIHYDENGQPIQYDANGQPIQYDENGQPIQYDENGQSIQYDGNNQPIQYDENGQPIHYDENGQAIQYDENGQPIYQYQYDENGQVIQQYGEYDSNDQNYQQYDENGQPLQDYSDAIPSEDNKHVSNTENGHFGEEILPTDNANQPVEDNIEIKEGMDDQPTTNKILDMLDTDTESLQQNVSKVSNDSDFTVST